MQIMNISVDLQSMVSCSRLNLCPSPHKYLQKHVNSEPYKYQRFTKMHWKPKIKKKINLDSYANYIPVLSLTRRST